MLSFPFMPYREQRQVQTGQRSWRSGTLAGKTSPTLCDKYSWVWVTGRYISDQIKLICCCNLCFQVFSLWKCLYCVRLAQQLWHHKQLSVHKQSRKSTGREELAARRYNAPIIMHRLYRHYYEPQTVGLSLAHLPELEIIIFYLGGLVLKVRSTSKNLGAHTKMKGTPKIYRIKIYLMKDFLKPKIIEISLSVVEVFCGSICAYCHWN